MNSLKKKLANMYSKVAPIVVAVNTIAIPHHFPKTKPENNKSSIAKPNSKTKAIQKIKYLML